MTLLKLITIWLECLNLTQIRASVVNLRYRVTQALMIAWAGKTFHYAQTDPEPKNKAPP